METEWQARLAERDAYIAQQDARLARQDARIAELEALVLELQARLNANSTKSNRPPSSDGLKKPNPKSLKKPGVKKVGAQPGHPGSTLSFLVPKVIIEHHPDTNCDTCGATLPESQLVAARQVFDVPPMVIEATEHRIYGAKCRCGKTSRGSWPSGVDSHVQYGSRIRALVVYLTQHHMLPFKRCSSLLGDLFHTSISTAIVQQACAQAAKVLTPIVAEIGDALSQSPIAYADETGFRVEKRLHWLHTVCTSTLTHIHCHRKRGYEAIKDGGILLNFRGILHHDCWKPYWLLNCEHAICNAHLLRELTAFEEDYDQQWAGKLKCIMLEALAELHRSEHAFSPERLRHYQHRASIQIGYGKRDNPEQFAQNGKRQAKQSAMTNFLHRFESFKGEIWRFAIDRRVSFTNNTAEQAIRMPKVKQKVSGCFRTLLGARNFCTIRSYTDTMRKQGENLLEILTQAFQGDVKRPSLAFVAAA